MSKEFNCIHYDCGRCNHEDNPTKDGFCNAAESDDPDYECPKYNPPGEPADLNPRGSK